MARRAGTVVPLRSSTRGAGHVIRHGSPVIDNAFGSPDAAALLGQCPNPSLAERRCSVRQIAQLVLGGRPAEDAIAMREAAEPFDDVVMLARVAHVLGEVAAPGFVHGGRERFELLDRSTLEDEVLGMLERHVEENAFHGMEGAVLPGFDGRSAVCSGLRVEHECTG